MHLFPIPGERYQHRHTGSLECCRVLQLPPVSAGGQRKRFAFEATCWSRCVPNMVELTQVFRQSDGDFISALNEIRVGGFSEVGR